MHCKYLTFIFFCLILINTLTTSIAQIKILELLTIQHFFRAIMII